MGTTLQATVSRVVDGDTIRVRHAHIEADEPLRILALDTEESRGGSGKPVTPWGIEAKAEAERFFNAGETVALEFPGHEPIQECLTKYRGNFGRLLVYVKKDGADFQEHMIRLGFSPYFTKYGYAPSSMHARYDAAEREAQSQHIGVWNQIAVNGSEIRNYAALVTWWRLRAEIIESYREIAGSAGLYNSRLDYAVLKQKAQDKQAGKVFTELRELVRLGKASGKIRIGSQEQPFSLFLPDIESPSGQQLVHLLNNRYISTGEDRPRRSYAYVAGNLSEFNGKPQILVDNLEQIQDSA